MQKKTAQIERRIEAIKAELMGLGDMRPGSLSTQSRSWGDQYCQLSYTHRGKSRTEFVRKEFVAHVQREIKNYAIFRELTKEWVDLSLEMARLRREKFTSKGSNANGSQDS